MANQNHEEHRRGVLENLNDIAMKESPDAILVLSNFALDQVHCDMCMRQMVEYHLLITRSTTDLNRVLKM